MSISKDSGRSDNNLTAKHYFVIGIIYLIIGGMVSVWGIIAYFDLKKAQKDYGELPHDVPTGSSSPYPAEDEFFWLCNGVIIIFFAAGTALLLKWELIR